MSRMEEWPLEDITPDEIADVVKEVEWLEHNDPIPHEEILSEFGLTTADWEKLTDEAE